MGVTPQAFPYSHLYIYSYSANYFSSLSLFFSFFPPSPLFLHPSFCVGRRHVVCLQHGTQVSQWLPAEGAGVTAEHLWLTRASIFVLGSSNGNWLPSVASPEQWLSACSQTPCLSFGNHSQQREMGHLMEQQKSRLRGPMLAGFPLVSPVASVHPVLNWQRQKLLKSTFSAHVRLE